MIPTADLKQEKRVLIRSLQFPVSLVFPDFSGKVFDLKINPLIPTPSI